MRQQALFEVDGVLLAIWGEVRGTVRDLLVNRSVDGGVTWQQQPTRLDLLVPDGVSEGFDVATDGTVVWVVWSEVQSSTSVICYQRSSDRGATWNAAATVLPLPSGASVASGLAAAGAVYALASSQYSLLRLAASADRGQTWTTSSWPSGGNGSYYGRPTLAAVDDTVFVAGTYQWVVSAVIYSGLVSTRSTNRGLTWSNRPLAATPPINPVSLGTLVAVLPTDSGIYLASSDIWGPSYLEMIAGHFRYGTGTAGAANLEPMLRGAGVPAPGAGAASLSITIPRNPAFSGWRINSQAFVLDSAGPGGFSATAGLESWVL